MALHPLPHGRGSVIAVNALTRFRLQAETVIYYSISFISEWITPNSDAFDPFVLPVLFRP
jgi:hypothetical protein